MTGELFAGTPDGLSDAEKQLETDISHAAMRFHTCRNPDERARWWATLKRLTSQRTAHTVARTLAKAQQP